MSTLRGSVRPRSAVGSASDSRVRGSGLDTRSGNIVSFHLPLFQEGQLNCYVHLVLVTRLEGQSLLSSSVVVVVVLLFYVHGKHLRSCRDGQLT